MRILLRLLPVVFAGLFVLIPKTLQLVSMKVNASESIIENNYYISQKNEDGEFDLVHTELYETKYQKKRYNFKQVDNALTLKIVHKNDPYGDLESIEAFGCNQRVDPEYAVYAESGESVVDDIVKDDLNVVVAHEKEIEINWNIPYWCDEDVEVYIKANSYGHGFPIVMPEKNFFKINDALPLENVTVDGYIHEIEESEADFEYLFQPSTGHPDGITYTYVRENGDYYYFAFDVTADNTNEQSEDWIEIELIEASGKSKRYRVDSEHERFGKCAFGITSKVSYKHKTCEFLIPKNNQIKGTLKMRVRYYGTVSIVYTFQTARGTENGIYTRKKTESSGLWSSYFKGGSTLSSISMARRYIDPNTYIYQAAKGTDGKVYTRYSTDGVIWGNWQGAGSSKGDVEMIYSSVGTSKVMQAIRGTDNKLYYRYTANGTTWTDWTQAPGTIKSDVSMSEGSFGGTRLYQAARGSDNKIYVRYTTDGNSWTNWQSLGGQTHDDVTIVTYYTGSDTDLVLAVRGTDNNVYTKFSEDGNTWTGWKRSGKTTGQVGMDSTWFSGEYRLYQAVRGLNDRMYYRYSVTGETWNAWKKLSGIECYGDPGLYEEPSHHYVYFSTRASDNTVHTQYVDNTDTWDFLNTVGKSTDRVVVHYY